MAEWRVDEEMGGERADVALAHLARVPRTAAREALRSVAVTLAGKVTRPGRRVEQGDVFSGEIATREHAAPGAEDIPLDVVHSDERVMVISKPAGLITHPAGGNEGGTLVNALLALGEPLALAGSDRPGIVHRLDKETSGLLLVAKDDEAHGSLVEALKRRAIERGYLALVRGPMPAASGAIDAPIDRHPARRTRMAVVQGGRPAVTHYEVLAATEEVSLLDVTLETGRTHQIRVHLAHLGHPILGDRTYGGANELAARLGLTRPFLHAYRLVFPHPDGGTVRFTSALPGELRSALAAAGVTDPTAA
ncbi:MAG: RluA family pseudouridine synthase [Actinobacteria bacterium]|nr:RluA family pseudouridine synthase [Actinomycetota bacterium]